MGAWWGVPAVEPFDPVTRRPDARTAAANRATVIRRSATGPIRSPTWMPSQARIPLAGPDEHGGRCQPHEDVVGGDCHRLRTAHPQPAPPLADLREQEGLLPQGICVGLVAGEQGDQAALTGKPRARGCEQSIGPTAV